LLVAAAEYDKQNAHGMNHSTLKMEVARSFSKHWCLCAKLHDVTP